MQNDFACFRIVNVKIINFKSCQKLIVISILCVNSILSIVFYSPKENNHARVALLSGSFSPLLAVKSR